VIFVLGFDAWVEDRSKKKKRHRIGNIFSSSKDEKLTSKNTLWGNTRRTGEGEKTNLSSELEREISQNKTVAV